MFVPNFSSVALPLTDLTKKGCPNELLWTDAQEIAFTNLKQSLVKFPILKLPNLSEPFILKTVASNRGIGAVLLQYEQDKKLPVAYASRKLKDSEASYATIEKECLAIVWSIQKFQKYLYGREFMLETDHKPLIYLNNAKIANSRLMQWALALQPYRFRIVAIKGTENVGGDYLKLYCRYEYRKPCMINFIWGLKTTMTSGEWTCLISFATAPLTCSERGRSEKFKMKMYVSSGIRTYTPLVHDRKVTAP